MQRRRPSVNNDRILAKLKAKQHQHAAENNQQHINKNPNHPALAGLIAVQKQVNRQMLTLDDDGNGRNVGHPDQGIRTNLLGDGYPELQHTPHHLYGDRADHYNQETG